MTFGLQDHLTNSSLLDDGGDDLTYDGGDSTIYEEWTESFSESNVEDFLFSSDSSTLSDLAEPFEFHEATEQKKEGENYLKIAEPEILFEKETDKMAPGGMSESAKALVEIEEKILREKASCNQCYNKEFAGNSLRSHMESMKCRCSNTKRPLDETTLTEMSIKRSKYSNW